MSNSISTPNFIVFELKNNEVRRGSPPYYSIFKIALQGLGVFSDRLEVFPNNFGSNKGTQSKRNDFSQNLMSNKVKDTNLQNWHQESLDLTIFGECLW